MAELVKKRLKDPLDVYACVEDGKTLSEAWASSPSPGFVYLIHIKTPKAKNTRKGYASRVLRYMQDDPAIGTIMTSWSDSSPEGRKLCIKNGFKKEKGNWLVWKDDKKLKEIHEAVQSTLRQVGSKAADRSGEVREDGLPILKTGHEQKIPRGGGRSPGGDGEIILTDR